MRKVVSIFAFITLLSSCDKIDDPIQNPDQGNGEPPQGTPVRKVLLEDYTGQTCGYCPGAAIVASDLKEQYKEKLVVVAVHAGDFAKVQPPKYPDSYTTTAGNDWNSNSGFGIIAAGNPNGMVNRTNYENNGLIQKEGKWRTTVPIALSQPVTATIQITKSYDPISRALSVATKVKFFTSYVNPTKLSLILTEDSIVSPQLDYYTTPINYIPAYTHMHMLRVALNDSWGSNLTTAAVAMKDSVSLSFNTFVLDSKFKDKNMHIVAFVYDALTREVIQAEEMKLKN